MVKWLIFGEADMWLQPFRGSNQKSMSFGQRACVVHRTDVQEKLARECRPISKPAQAPMIVEGVKTGAGTLLHP